MSEQPTHGAEAVAQPLTVESVRSAPTSTLLTLVAVRIGRAASRCGGDLGGPWMFDHYLGDLQRDAVFAASLAEIDRRLPVPA